MQGAPECTPLIGAPGTQASDVVPWPRALRLLPRSMPPALPPGSGPHCSQHAQGAHALLFILAPSADCWTVWLSVSIGGPFRSLLALPSLASRWGGFPGVEEEKLGPAGPPSLAPYSAGCLGRLCPHTPASAPLGPSAGCAPRAALPPAPLRSPRAPPGCSDPCSSPPAQRAPSVRAQTSRAGRGRPAVPEGGHCPRRGSCRRSGTPCFSTRPCPQFCSRPRGRVCPRAAGVFGLRSRHESASAGVRAATEVAAGSRCRADSRGARRQGGLGRGEAGAPALRAAQGAGPRLVCACLSGTQTHGCAPSTFVADASRPRRAQGAVLRRFFSALGSPLEPEAAAPAAPCVLAKGACPSCAGRAIYVPEMTVNLPCPHPALVFSRRPALPARAALPGLRGLVGARPPGAAVSSGSAARCPRLSFWKSRPPAHSLGMNTALPAFFPSLLAAVSLSTC